MKKNTVMYRPLKNVVSDIERDLMFEIILHMKVHKLSLSQAQRLAAEFLEVIDAKNKKQLFKKMSRLSFRYQEASEVYVKYKKIYLEEKKNRTVRQASHAIHNYEIDRAVRIVKGGMYE